MKLFIFKSDLDVFFNILLGIEKLYLNIVHCHNEPHKKCGIREDIFNKRWISEGDTHRSVFDLNSFAVCVTWVV